ncbi:MAG: MFS transporter [Proteobacteria bacterium]|nr:MFS transporter [Pseudomonadota bacterium]
MNTQVDRQDDTARGVVTRTSMFQSLAIRDFRLLWLSNLCASFAMQMQMIARGWLIYDMTNSAMALAWVMLSFMLPSFVFSLAGGVIADRMHKKQIMIVSQVLNAIATAVLAYVIFIGEVTFWHFIYIGLFNGTVLSFSMPARSAVIPEVVGPDNLVNAMALQSATFNLSRILGPVLAGGLIAVFAAGDTTSTHGVGIVFFIIAGLYLVSVGGTLLLNYVGAPVAREKTTPLEDVKEGFRYMKREPLIVGLLIMGFVPFTFGWSVSFLLPAFNHDVLGGGPEDLGILMTGIGAGALGGSLILARLGDFNQKGRVMFIAAYIWAASVALFALSFNMLMALVIGAVTGLFSSLLGSLNMSVVQLAISSEIRGRVMSIMMMAHGLMPLGVLPVSALAEFVGIDVALMFSAGMLALSMVLLGVFFPDLRRIDRGHGSAALVGDRPR